MHAFRYCLVLFIALCLTTSLTQAQVAINSDGSPPHSSAMLDVSSTVSGLLVPRMTTAQRITLGAIAIQGLMVYDTDLDRFYFHNGTIWEQGSVGNLWSRSGSYTYTTNLGDFVGIGTSAPVNRLDVYGSGSNAMARLRSGTGTTGLMIDKKNASDYAYVIFQTDGTSKWYLGTMTDDDFAIGTTFLPSDRKVTIDNTGNMGVGTSSPVGRLHIHDANSTNTTVYITPQDPSFNDSTTLFFGEDDDATYGMYWLYDGAAGTGGNMELWGRDNSGDYGPHIRVARGSGLVTFGESFATGYRLSVEGKIICTELRVNAVVDWPDYVFHKDYSLMGISDLSSFIKQHGRLPEVPSSAEIEESGIDVGEMQKLMMKKIEELSLYIIQQQETIDGLTKIVAEQSAKLDILKTGGLNEDK